MKVSLNIHYRDQRTKLFRRILNYINPDSDNQSLLNFVHSLNILTTNNIVEVIKVVNSWLDEDIYSSFSEDDVDFIFDGNNFYYSGFSAEDVNFIFCDRVFVFTGFSQADVDFVFY